MGLLKNSKYASAVVLLLTYSDYANSANDVNTAVDNRPLEEVVITTPPSVNTTQKQILPELKAEQEPENFNTKEELIAYLSQNPNKMEKLLTNLIRQAKAAELAELLPVYAQYVNHDPSVIEWGNAIIAQRKGNYHEAIRLYRKLNSALPNVKTLRFQMAVALFQDRQFTAAQHEFEKLRSEDLPEKDMETVDYFIEMIKAENDWTFDVSLNFLNDKNLTNAPPVGTKLGTNWTYTSKHESGKGVGFSVGTDKKWLSDKKYFSALHLSSFGKKYFDNKKFDDISATAAVGFGYQNAEHEIEIAPEISQRWYAGGTSGNNQALKPYSSTKGIAYNQSYWFNPKLKYQNFTKYSKTNYVESYKANDSSDLIYSNSLIFFPSQIQYFFGGVDLVYKFTDDDALSFTRKGVRLGWGRAWSYGMSSRAHIGYANQKYKGQDFFGIQKSNNEYRAGLTLWNRGLYIIGLTPKISWNYAITKSNSPFEEYDKHNVSMELSKTF